MPNGYDTRGKKMIELLAMAVDGIAILAIIYSAIIIRKTGGTVFLLQLQIPLSILKRWLMLGGERQPFLVGGLAREMVDPDPEKIFDRLIAMGYQWDYFAYHDDGEIISMRKLYDRRQIHVRVFRDGEIRMHDELNYEFEPIDHLKVPLEAADATEIDKVLSALDETGVRRTR